MYLEVPCNYAKVPQILAPVLNDKFWNPSHSNNDTTYFTGYNMRYSYFKVSLYKFIYYTIGILNVQTAVQYFSAFAI